MKVGGYNGLSAPWNDPIQRLEHLRMVMNPPCISRQSLSLFSSPYHYKYHATLHYKPTLSITNSTTPHHSTTIYIIVFISFAFSFSFLILSWVIITSISHPASDFTLLMKSSSSISSTARPPSCPAIQTSSLILISIPMIPGSLMVPFILLGFLSYY